MLFGTSSFTGGFIAGFASGFLTREILRLGAMVARPLTKAVVKTGITTFERGRETVAHLGESFEDLVAEVKASLSQIAKEPSEAVAAASAGGATSNASGEEKVEDKDERDEKRGGGAKASTHHNDEAKRKKSITK